MVLAVYICIVCENVERTEAASTAYTSACAWTRASMSNRIITSCLGIRGLPILQKLAVGLESGHNIQLWHAFAGAGADGTSVNHQARAVQSPNCRHISLNKKVYCRCDARAINTPGIFLSQPGTVTIPSSQ